MTLKMDEHVLMVELIIDYTFTDPFKLWEALQAPGSPVPSIGGRPIPEGNKRLAMIGDSVLKLAMVSHWYTGTGLRGKIHTGNGQSSN